MGADHDAELAELAALTAEHLRWEMDLGNRGLPDVRELLAQARQAAAEEANAHDAAAPEASGPPAPDADRAHEAEPAPEARAAGLPPGAARSGGGGAAHGGDELGPGGAARSGRPPNEARAGGEPGRHGEPASGGAARSGGPSDEARAGGDPGRHGEPASGAAAADGDAIARLRVLADEVASCTRCGLHRGRTKAVFARGNPRAPLVFVGEGPGYHEDQQGLPFVGKAGQLLDRMIAAMGFTQDEVYICNVVKCRPPNNRTPNPDEAGACMPFLREQLGLVKPEVIVALGRHAAENLGVAEPGRRWRGTWGRFEGVRVMSTYHPAYLLRNPEQKRPVWHDLQAVVAEMGRELPSRRR